jgi:hypothetical protein
MPHSNRLLTVVGCLTLGFLASPLAAQGPKADPKDAAPKLATQGATPAVGEITLDYTFQNFISGDGRTSMKELRGNVVLVDWWGIH